jgi:hypothetical protein
MNNLSQFKAELEKDTRLYHPKWNRFTGSLNATVILQEANYWFNLNWPGHKASQPFYREVEEWLERLEMGRKAFLNARDSLGRQIKISQDETHLDAFAEGHLLAWYTDQQHRTWYYVNNDLLNQRLTELYFPESPLGIRENDGSPNPLWGFGRIPKGDSDSSEITTEITHEEADGLYLENPGNSNQEQKPEPVRVELDDLGNEVPVKFEKTSPFIRLILDNLLGSPKNLQGRERALFEEHVLSRARDDAEWARWCIWMAQNNARGNTLNIYLKWLITEEVGKTFEDWRAGRFTSVEEWLKKPNGKPHSRHGKGQAQEFINSEDWESRVRS